MRFFNKADPFSKNVIIFTVPDEMTKKAASPDTAFLFLT